MKRLALFWVLGLPLCAGPTIDPPRITPLTLPLNQPTVVTASCKINTSAGDPALLPGGVSLVRLTVAGAAVSTIGVIHDDGLNGDGAAGDGVFTLQFTANETTAGQFQFQCTAAFQGVLQRIKSPAVTITVTPGSTSATISAPDISPASIPLGAPSQVTTSVGITGATPDEGSVMLQRLDPSGRVLAILGTLQGATGGVYRIHIGVVALARGGKPICGVAFSIARDGGTARKNAGRLQAMVAQTHVPVALVVAGPGWSLRNESAEMAAAFAGRVYSDRTIRLLAAAIHDDHLVETKDV